MVYLACIALGMMFGGMLTSHLIVNNIKPR
jgi:hypothetical protein